MKFSKKVLKNCILHFTFTLHIQNPEKYFVLLPHDQEFICLQTEPFFDNFLTFKIFLTGSISLKVTLHNFLHVLN